MSTKKCPYCCEDIQEAAIKCKHCGSILTGDLPPQYTATASTPGVIPRRLTRSRPDCMIGGVCGGIANALGIDPTLVRVLYALASLFTAGFPGVVLYIILWIIIPEEGKGT